MAIDKDYLMSLSVDDALRAEIERLRAALEPFTKVGRDLVRVGASVIPDGASANRLKLDGIYAKHFREAAIAFGYEQSTGSCLDCGQPREEHHYNGACYGVCGQFRANGQSPR